jgi:small multidrug resistance pump
MERMWLSYALFMVLGWSCAVVLDSVLVKHYIKNPFILMWTQSCFSILFLATAYPFVSLESSWILIFALSAILAYCGDLVFFLAIERMDASIFNIAWAVITIILSIVGFIFFGESWTLLQTIAVVCILLGVVFLSYVHHHITLKAFGLLLALAILYSPVNIAMKAALEDGEQILTILFWTLAIREGSAFLLPLCWPKLRRYILSLPTKVDAVYVGVSGLVVAVYFTGEYFAAKAYAAGSMSLVSVVGNLQPFVVLFLAWVIWRLVPRYASRELLDSQSVRVKLISFSVVFVGMVLLAV